MILPPGRNPLTRACDLCHQERAVADARLQVGPWAYLCLSCLRENAIPHPKLITNITDQPLELDWL
jgi:hypothetical protein